LTLSISELPPLFRDQRKIDSDHLNLLAIFHFVGAGLALLGILFLFVHYSIMHHFLSNPQMWENQTASPEGFFWIFKWFYILFGIWFVCSGILNVISGLWMRARKNRTFSIVVAVLNCLHVPLGTILGVFTMVVLMRDSVREIYKTQHVDP
jgi:hypothetical protein